MKDKKIAPFVKWAGGKRQLIEKIMDKIPSEYNTFYEPFIGGGALFFSLKPYNSKINDINEALINTYRTIRDNPDEFINVIDEFDQRNVELGKEYYYQIRERFNEKILKNEFDIEMASLFVFLNKHCFNGLYRVNSKGMFNVPYNNSISKSYSKENILSVSAYLKDVEITVGDFEKAVSEAGERDFVFFDSPYAPLNVTSFKSYTKEGFDKESHERLARLFDELTKKGCYCILTNHNTEFINQLYENYSKEVVTVRRFINSDSSNRKGEELIVWNF